MATRLRKRGKANINIIVLVLWMKLSTLNAVHAEVMRLSLQSLCPLGNDVFKFIAIALFRFHFNFAKFFA